MWTCQSKLFKWHVLPSKQLTCHRRRPFLMGQWGLPSSSYYYWLQPGLHSSQLQVYTLVICYYDDDDDDDEDDDYYYYFFLFKYPR